MSGARHLRVVPAAEILGRITPGQWGEHEPACGWDEWDEQVRANNAALDAPPSLDRRCHYAGVPLLLAEELERGLDQNRAMRELGADWAGKYFAVLAGPTGCGKSLAACHWLVERGSWQREGEKQVWRAGKFISAADLVTVGQFDQEALLPLVAAPSLVIDDLAQEFADRRGWFSQRIDDVLKKRHERKRPTVITTNKGWSAIERIYGERVTSRLCQCAVWIDLQGEPDLRRSGR